MIASDSFFAKYSRILKENIPNIKSSIYTAIFNKKIINETTDALVFGFYIGFFSSCSEITVNENEIKKMLEIYAVQAKGSDSLDMLIEQISIEYAQYFSRQYNAISNDLNDSQIKELGNNNDINVNNTIKRRDIVNINEQTERIENDNHNGLINDKEDNNVDEDNNRNDNKGNNNNNINYLKDLYFEDEEGEGEELPKKKCLICLEEFNIEDELTYWLDCSCIIHNKCFDQYVASCVNDNSLPIKCPECSKEINSTFIYESLNQSNPDLIPKYEKFSLNLYAINNKDDVNCCPTPGCSYMFFYQEGDARFVCPSCEKDYCFVCKTDWHEDITCEENKKLTNVNYLDETFDKYVKGAQYKQCPFCSSWVERVSGCDYMACRCKNAFCYHCGEKNPKSHFCRNKEQNNQFLFPALFNGRNIPRRNVPKRNIPKRRAKRR